MTKIPYARFRHTTRIDLLPAAARAVLTLSAHWLEITDKPAIHTATALDAGNIFSALSEGKTVIWNDWSLRVTPPRPDGECTSPARDYPAIWVMSSKGFSPFSRLDPESVFQACQFIRKREEHAQTIAQIDFSDEPCY